MTRPAAFVLGLTHAGLVAVRSLGRAGVRVLAIDHDPAAPGTASRFGEFQRCPPAERGDELLRFLLRLRQPPEDPPVLIAARDEFFHFVHSRAAELAPHFRFTRPGPLAVEIGVHKRRQYELAEKLGVPHPKSYYPESLDDVRWLEVRYPAYIKPYHAHQWWKLYFRKGIVVANAGELTAAFAAAFERGQMALVQEIVPGPDSNVYEVGVYIDHEDRVVAAAVVRKLRQWPPHFGEASIATTADDAGLLQLGLRYARGCGFRGIGAMEFKWDERDGSYKFLELNPRLWSHAQLVVDSGLDLPLLEYQELIGQPITPPADPRATGRWLSPMRDVRSFWWSWRNEGLSPVDWIRSLRGVTSHASFAWDDPMPFLREVATSATNAVRAVLFPAYRRRETQQTAGLASLPQREDR